MALAVNRITFPTGDEGYWCGFEQCDGDDAISSTACGLGTYQDGCDLCIDNDCDSCKQSMAGYAWLALNILAGLCCIIAALGVIMKKGKKFAKFLYLIAAFCLIGAVLWFCFGSPICYQYDSDFVDPTLGYSMYFDIIAIVFLFLATYCVC